MNLLTILILINCVLILLYFLTGKTSHLSYTESIISRKIGGYIITLLALIVICLMLLNVAKGILFIAYGINIMLGVVLIALLIKRI